MKKRVPTLNDFLDESNKALVSDQDLIDIIWTAMTPTDRNQLSRKIGVEIRRDKPNTDQVLNAIKSKEDIMRKFYPELFEKINEERIKSHSDIAFLTKIVNALDKAGFGTSVDYTKGYVTVTGPGDDEKIKFEYFY